MITEINKSSLVCWGCTKATGWSATGYVCPVFAEPHKVHMVRRGGCTFNGSMDKNSKKTGKVRVGQQKQKKGI